MVLLKSSCFFGCISIFDNDPKSYSYWKLSYSIAIVRAPRYSQIVWAFAWGFKSGSQIPSNAKFAHDTHVFGLGCAWLMNVDETFGHWSSFIIYFFNDFLINLYICSTMTLFY